MRILVYGAGVLGSNLAHSLFIAKKDVTILARGKWYDTIKNEGLIIKNKLSLFPSKDKINVINALLPNDAYDAIFVVLQYSQLDSIFDILKANDSKNIIFVGNNITPEKYVKLLPDKNVYFAFYSACGKKEETRISSLAMNKITIGGPNEIIIKQVFSDTKITVVWEQQMLDWLKSHAAFILPLACACYYTDGKLRKLNKDKTFVDKIVLSIKEGYDILIANGTQIKPDGDYEFVTVNSKNCYKFIHLCSSTFIGKLAIADHSMGAAKEMNLLMNVLLSQKGNVEANNLIELSRYINKYAK